jgi:site-specific DNA recombinase
MRAVGIIRVSRTKGEGIVSPSEQRKRIKEACERDGMQLVSIFEELDVSGGAALEKRPGLSRAVSMIEAGDADTIVVAYFDRLVRLLSVQSEIVSRVEAAGGRILAVDVGQVTNGSAGQWLSGKVLGLVSEYQRRTTAERTQDAKRRAIARGVPTFDRIPPGYRHRADKTLEIDPKTAPIVQEAFRLRASGSGIKDVQQYLRANGIHRTFTSTQTMLRSRIYLGELHFGELQNLSAHEPLIDADLWRKVQTLRVPRGRKSKSDRLLARLGVLRCATCGARMVVGTTRANGRDYPMYRCPPNSDCPRRVTISAEIAEQTVVQRVRELLDGISETASVADGAHEAEAEAERLELELNAAVRAFDGLEDVAATRERLLELRDLRDRARDRADELRGAVAPSVTVSASGDWDVLTLDEQRAIIRAVVDRVTVAPGRGRDRLTVEPRNVGEPLSSAA